MVDRFYSQFFDFSAHNPYTTPTNTDNLSHEESNSMSDTTNTQRPPLPDRLSVNPRSPYFNAEVFKNDVGIKLNDKEHLNVEEYCISEGWIAVSAGKALDRKGNPLMIKLKGKVESFFR